MKNSQTKNTSSVRRDLENVKLIKEKIFAKNQWIVRANRNKLKVKDIQFSLGKVDLSWQQKKVWYFLFHKLNDDRE